MKLRLHKQSLRLRLNEKDLDILQNQGEIHEALHISETSRFNYSLILSETAEKLCASVEGPHIRILLPKERGLSWLRSEEISLKEKDSLKILIEKDLPREPRGKESSHDR